MSDYKRFTEKRKGKNVIPLRNSACGFDLPKWSIDYHSDIQSFLSGDAVDRLAELEDIIEKSIFSLGRAEYVVFKIDDCVEMQPITVKMIEIKKSGGIWFLVDEWQKELQE